jgi:hypothetical protein
MRLRSVSCRPFWLVSQARFYMVIVVTQAFLCRYLRMDLAQRTLHKTRGDSRLHLVDRNSLYRETFFPFPYSASQSRRPPRKCHPRTTNICGPCRHDWSLRSSRGLPHHSFDRKTSERNTLDLVFLLLFGTPIPRLYNRD